MDQTAIAEMTIDEFCDKHSACPDGRKWAIENCSSMRDAWGKLPFDYLLWTATRPGVLTNRELRLFAVFCARHVEHLLTYERSKTAISVAERFAVGEATEEEMAAAWEAAWAAAREAAGEAAREAAREAAGAAAWAAAGEAAREAAGEAAREAAWAAAGEAAREAAGAAAREAAWAAAGEAAREAFAGYLRDKTDPIF